MLFAAFAVELTGANHLQMIRFYRRRLPVQFDALRARLDRLESAATSSIIEIKLQGTVV